MNNSKTNQNKKTKTNLSSFKSKLPFIISIHLYILYTILITYIIYIDYYKLTTTSSSMSTKIKTFFKKTILLFFFFLSFYCFLKTNQTNPGKINTFHKIHKYLSLSNLINGSNDDILHEIHVKLETLDEKLRGNSGLLSMNVINELRFDENSIQVNLSQECWSGSYDYNHSNSHVNVNLDITDIIEHNDNDENEVLINKDKSKKEEEEETNSHSNTKEYHKSISLNNTYKYQHTNNISKSIIHNNQPSSPSSSSQPKIIIKERQPNTNKIRYCSSCFIIKPDRAHHCKDCNTCILKCDHHCPWIDNCIWIYNMKYFLLFLLYTNIALLCIIYELYSYQKTIFLIGKYIFSIVFFLIFVLFSFSSMLLVKNRTNFEYSKMLSLNEDDLERVMSRYDNGVLYNIKEVLGESVLMWFLPITIGTKGFDYIEYGMNFKSNDFFEDDVRMSY